MRINATLVGGDRAVARFKAMPDRLRQELTTGITRAALLVQRDSMQQKLSGQVLNVRTGRLRRSININVQGSEDKVTGTVGTNVEYAAVHEYGFEGTVTVREHLRRTVSGKQVVVRSHPMHMNVPEKSFLRSALNDMQPQIRIEFEQAAARALRA
jgi:phage gpG-like protein